jgi:hypothetical protein
MCRKTVFGPRASPVVEDHFRRLDAAIYGLCPIQETARAILGIEEISDNFEHHGVGRRDTARRRGLEQCAGPDA